MKGHDLTPEQEVAFFELFDKIAAHIRKERIENPGKLRLDRELKNRRDPWNLSDDEWRLIQLQLVNASPKKKTGRPRAELRILISAILWFLHHPGAQWRDLPNAYPPYSTCYRYYATWRNDGTLDKVIRILGISPKRGF